MAMSGLIIVADTSSLARAAGELAAGFADLPAAHALPSFGEPGADAAAEHFTRRLAEHASRVADSAARGSRHLHGFSESFVRVGS